ncbi:hypothetical protein [Phenylobacterium sp.]|uniref:hypothetical protein n=1 Tax=Phenylobacterium sp. TaxID=1871053 RepID=UPI00286D4E6A|nr:hypothetical protein [Phenylobacterium sp.]
MGPIEALTAQMWPGVPVAPNLLAAANADQKDWGGSSHARLGSPLGQPAVRA